MVLAHFSIVGALRAISRAIQISFNICSSSTGFEMAAPQSGGTFKLCEWSKYLVKNNLVLVNCSHKIFLKPHKDTYGAAVRL